MAAIFGAFDTDDWGNERPTAFSDKILYHYPDGPAKFTMLLGRLKPKAVDDPKFTIFEKGLQVKRAKLTGTHIESATVLNLDTSTSLGSYPGAYFHIGQVLMVERTGERVLVTGGEAAGTEPVSTSTRLTITRDLDGGAATADYALVATDYVIVVGNGYEEGADTPRAMHENPDEVYNYTQTFRTSMYLTGTAKETYLRTGKPEANQKFEKALEHARDLEMAMIFGARYKTTGSGGAPLRFTGGLRYFVTTNVTDFSTAGGISLGTWEEFLEGIYTGEGGGDTKIALCGARALTSLNRLAIENSSMTTVPGDQSFGMKFKEYEHAHGSLMCTRHPLLRNEFADAMFIVDPMNVRRRFMKNRDTKFLKERQGNGVDAIIHEFLTDTGLELQHEQTHGIAYGVSSYIP